MSRFLDIRTLLPLSVTTVGGHHEQGTHECSDKHLHLLLKGTCTDPELCVTENATILHEGETLEGKKAIREWMEKTKRQYSPKFRPIGIKENTEEIILTAEVSGTFDGSPVNLDFHFKIKNNLIQDLRVL